MRFEWDSEKNEANRKKHGVGFAEAVELFESAVDFLEIYDEAHSTEEERFIAVGPVRRGLLLVVWTEPVEDVVRIISARFATKRETDLYWQRLETKS